MTVKTSIKVPNQRSKEEQRAHLKTHQSLNLALIIEKISRQIKASHQSSAPRKFSYLRCVLPVHSVDGRGRAHALVHVSHELVVGRVVARMRPEVSRALHGGRSCRYSACVISTGRCGRRTPARNFEAKRSEKGWSSWWGCLVWDGSKPLLLHYSNVTQGLKKPLRYCFFANGARWRTESAKSPQLPNGVSRRRAPLREIQRAKWLSIRSFGLSWPLLRLRPFALKALRPAFRSSLYPS